MNCRDEEILKKFRILIEGGKKLRKRKKTNLQLFKLHFLSKFFPLLLQKHANVVALRSVGRLFPLFRLQFGDDPRVSALGGGQRGLHPLAGGLLRGDQALQMRQLRIVHAADRRFVEIVGGRASL